MASPNPAIVIDNGSYSTRAGLALDELPSLVFSSNHSVSPLSQEAVFGNDELLAHPSNEIMSIMDNGLVYDYEKLEGNWKYVFENLDNGSPVDPSEYPLVLTEQTWNTPKNKLAATQLAFEKFQIPLFSLVKSPLAQLYHLGKATGLVIDIGSSVTSVTPIVDGIIQTKASFYNKYAGDFVNLNIATALQKQATLADILPKKFINSPESFQNYYLTRDFIQDYKLSGVSEYLLPNGKQFKTNGVDFFNYLLQPHTSQIGVTLPQPVFEKPQTLGIVGLVLHSLKTLESPIVQNMGLSGAKFARFDDMLKSLLSNIVMTGGSSIAPGLPERVLAGIKGYASQYFPNYGLNQYYIQTVGNYQPGEINDTLDRLFSSWIGTSNLALMLSGQSEESNNMNIALDNWFVSKADYEEMGEELILEKFK